MSNGIRPKDLPVFAEAARKFSVWLVLRQTNQASWKYIGLPGYFPKPITCKAKTADLPSAGYDIQGLVADPTRHKNVFGKEKMGSAMAIWNQFKIERLDAKETPYALDLNLKSSHYGCVLYRGRYVYSDYDLYDIITVGHENANLALMGERDGVADYTTAHQKPIERFLNAGIGAEMVHHGGQFQFSEHTGDIVDIFGPKGERFTEPAAPWYAEHFPKRRAPGPDGGFISMYKK